MKKNHKTMICALTAGLAILAAAPATAFAAETESSYSSEWVSDESGRLFYYDAEGNCLVGEQEVDGDLYLFSQNGVLKTGWRTVAGKRRYYDPETGKPVYGWLDYNGKKYYVAPDNGKETGIFTSEDGSKFIADNTGALVVESGFFRDDENIYYAYEDGSLASGEAVIDGFPYFFDDECREMTGWVENGDKAYYYDPETGAAAKGLFVVGDDHYYVDAENGKATGVTEIDGIKYLFGDDGALAKGWVEIDGKKEYFYDDASYAVSLTTIDEVTYLFNENGILATGFTTISDKTFYSNSDGVALSGRQTINGAEYFFGSDYAMQTGIVTIDGGKYFYAEDGKRQNGFVKYDGNTYYFNETDGKMQLGWKQLGELWYYFSSDGTMRTGWLEDKAKNKKYYLYPETGIMATGITEINGAKYYFHIESGALTTGRLIINGNKYYFGDDGKMQFGWKKFDNQWYYFGDDGKMMTGWIVDKGKKYYLYPSTGIMAANLVIDGVALRTDGSATSLSAVQQRAQSVISSRGSSISQIYNFVCGNNNYKFIESTRSLAQINSMGWGYFANYALNNRFIVCYYFAALTDLLFKQAGYQTRIVYGTGRGTSDHYWNQVLVNGAWVNYDTCNGYYAVTDGYLATQNYTFKQYVYATYY